MVGLHLAAAGLRRLLRSSGGAGVATTMAAAGTDDTGAGTVLLSVEGTDAANRSGAGLEGSDGTCGAPGRTAGEDHCAGWLEPELPASKSAATGEGRTADECDCAGADERTSRNPLESTQPREATNPSRRCCRASRNLQPECK
jgi:hypothetical protein